jgi:hypothetical protein
MYSSLPLVLMTYLEFIELGAHSISLGIHFSINASMLGLVIFFYKKTKSNDALQKKTL